MGNYKERHDLPGISVAGAAVVGTASLVVVGVVVSIIVVAWGPKTPSPLAFHKLATAINNATLFNIVEFRKTLSKLKTKGWRRSAANLCAGACVLLITGLMGILAL